MSDFITVYFWLALISILLRVVTLGWGDYPREISRGIEAASIILSLPFVAWAAYLLWR